nr:hypothetical protein Iba_chr03bCG9970 [Ipomoea batatas]
MLARRPDQPKNGVLRHDVVRYPRAAARGSHAGRAYDAPPHAPLHHRSRACLTHTAGPRALTRKSRSNSEKSRSMTFCSERPGKPALLNMTPMDSATATPFSTWMSAITTPSVP